jgi:hypothetical protein
MNSISKKETILILVSGVGGLLLVGFSATSTGEIFNTHPAVMFTGFVCGIGAGTIVCLVSRKIKK